ncbi:LexA family transcriptional regulator [Prosthecobacter vanneervenii]|uniref:Transcriptional regulator with XRE-family HTH domain n=1 Tax=Prosthecobacter vanneervenii TaxID=48466 RepID=A0A7W7YGP0_9BACT|nr:LexA family transcriptional regulator [Prosthecobacter vanneervenii]MBB5035520.1 transcriptional regulator with XRE-family HTH domain [Prosthecobacter vanneervenii]
MPHSPVSEEKLVGFPARCQSLRQKLRVSRPELASWLGVGRSYVSVMEKGRLAPSRPVFQLIEKLEAAANLKQLAMHMPQPDTTATPSPVMSGLPPEAIAALDRLVQSEEEAPSALAPVTAPAMPEEMPVTREKNAFALRVAALRAKMGVTRPKLAQRLGVSRQYVTKIENGAHASLPVIKLIEKLEAEILNGTTSSSEPTVHDTPSAALSAAPAIQPAAVIEAPAGAPSPPLPPSIPAAPVSGMPRISALPVLTIPAARDLTAPSLAAFAATEHFAFSVTDPDAFAMRLAGDAMLPQHHDGELAILYPNTAPHTGNRVIARLSDSLGGDILFRIYSTADHGHSIVLSSLNPLYPPVTLTPDEIAWIYPVATTVRQMLL